MTFKIFIVGRGHFVLLNIPSTQENQDVLLEHAVQLHSSLISYHWNNFTHFEILKFRHSFLVKSAVCTQIFHFTPQSAASRIHESMTLTMKGMNF